MSSVKERVKQTECKTVEGRDESDFDVVTLEWEEVFFSVI